MLARDAEGNPCIEVKSPVDLEQAVRLPGGNIFHRSLQWPWAERDAEVGTWGVETAYGNVLLSGPAPAGVAGSAASPATTRPAPCSPEATVSPATPRSCRAGDSSSDVCRRCLPPP